MNYTEIIELVTCAIRALDKTGVIAIYAFGSASRGETCWSDVDVLAVCEHEADCVLVRKQLELTVMSYPIDLVIMTVEEESSFNFVKAEKCVLIYQSLPRN